MELCLTLDHRFLQTPDSRVWTVTQGHYSFYSEYLNVFDRVRVIARGFQVPKAESNFLPVEGPGVEFFPVPSYKGPVQYIARYPSIYRSLGTAVPRGSAVILRVPSQVANSVERSIRYRRHPYALDVVADPYDVLSPAANPHPLAPVARMYFTHNLKEQAKHAVAISYVTQSYLQKRYPPRKDAFIAPPVGEGLPFDQRIDRDRQYAVGVSDASLPEDWFLDKPRKALQDPQVIRVIFIGTLGSLYKGPDTLIRAVAISRSTGIRVMVRFAGSGKQMDYLKGLCGELGVCDQISFLGDVQVGAGIREEIDRADVFVLPSRAEGVPRAMLEAMARSKPCLGSHTGGIPELLHEEDRVSPNDAAALAGKFTELVRDPSRIERMSIRNYQTARKYATQVLRERRRNFLLAVRERTGERLSSVDRTIVAMQAQP
ncbi:MAG: glycosyltransferase family 4 protein [Terracidiphilus sp.]